jgi:hypothetical protein
VCALCCSVEPGIIRELTNITLDIVEGKHIHIMETPEMLIKFAFRDVVNNPATSFNNALLERLIALKLRQNRSLTYDKAKIIILEGGEYEI